MTVWVKLHVNVFCVLEGCVNVCILQVLSTYASRCALFVVVGVTMWGDKIVTQFSYRKGLSSSLQFSGSP